LKNSFLPNLGILWFQNPMVFFGNIKYYHAVVRLESFLTLAYWYTKIFSSLDNQYWRVPFSTKLIGLNVV
jgi:hypothetical protein